MLRGKKKREQNISVRIKGKGKGRPITGHKDPEGEQVYSSTLPSTSALDLCGCSSRPGRFTPMKDPVPIVQEQGGPQGRSGRVRKISPPHGDPILGPSSP